MRRIYVLTDRKLKQIISSQVSSALITSNVAYEHELLMKQANINALQAQITPHFLYNALECIRGQAIADGSERIASISLALSQFFHYSISHTNNTMTLRSELDNVRDYVAIQQFRFQDKFTLEFHYDENDIELLNALLPKLTLQPIVENSIVHGLCTVETGGRIVISASRTQQNLTITVSDNGTGIKPDNLRELNGWIQAYYENAPDSTASETKPKLGIALANVDRRIKLSFGSDYGLTVYSNYGSGTDVELFLPFRLVI